MSIEHLHAVRDAELKAAVAFMPPPDGGVRILDLGAGTGRQSALLAGMGYSVTAIDLPSSAYAAQRVYPVLDYDGKTLPMPDGGADVVFSSNVLEHVQSLEDILQETSRVLTAGGLAIHVLPTTAWRIWTTLAHYPWLLKRLMSRRSTRSSGHGQLAVQGKVSRLLAMLLPDRHGERGNFLSEAWYFSESWWRGAFTRAGFDLVAHAPAGLAYTGSMLFAEHISIGARRRLALLAGSSCRIYVLRMRGTPSYPERNG